MTLKCAIIDDEPLARDLLESYVKKTPFLELDGKYSSAIQAFKDLAHRPVEVLFLDIQMPELGGMEFAHMLPPSTKIIFTTAFPEFAAEAYRVNAIDYLVKPINYTEFLESANKALQWHQSRGDSANGRNVVNNSIPKEEKFIFVKSDYKLLQIPFDKIIYIEGLKDYLKIYVEDEPHPILTLVSMKAMEERLPNPMFMRVHRSYIVNTDRIKMIDKGHIIYEKTRIPITDGYKAEVQKFINSHLV